MPQISMLLNLIFLVVTYFVYLMVNMTKSRIIKMSMVVNGIKGKRGGGGVVSWFPSELSPGHVSSRRTEYLLVLLHYVPL
jgi:hypothetical protein